MPAKNVFVTGGTGYLGRGLIPELLSRGHTVRALVRSGSESKLPPGCRRAIGDALDKQTFVADIPPADTFVQMVGVPHPSPRKARRFQEVDLVSVRASVAAACEAGVSHFVYVSVAQPAPVMKAYQAVRAEGGALLRSSGLKATILRPWYILGPGHWWPCLLLPGYWVAGCLPFSREGAERLGLITLKQMVAALVHAVENRPANFRIMTVPDLRKASG